MDSPPFSKKYFQFGDPFFFTALVKRSPIYFESFKQKFLNQKKKKVSKVYMKLKRSKFSSLDNRS